MACTHPAICNGVCLVCHEKIENGVNKPVEVATEETDATKVEQPVKAQETAKKTTTRKRKA